MNNHDIENQGGVRAEPKLLRDPTSLESLSSGLSWLSLYVTSNIQKKRTSGYDQPPPPSSTTTHEQHDDTTSKHEKVTYASFQQVQGNGSSSAFLLMGYEDGFQLWNVTNLDNIHEACSVRDPQQQLGRVKFMHILCHPDEIDYPSSKERPLLALVCDIHHHDTITTSEQHHQNTTILRFYSLHTQEFVREFQHVGDENSCIKSIQSNSRYIVLGCISNNTTTKEGLPTGTLHILWNSTLEQACSPFTDVACYQPSGPVYALGSRYLAYATTTEVSLKEDRSGNFLVHMTDKDMMKEAARGIAKEVVSGVRSLGEYGYQSLSNYFNQQESPPIDMAFQQQHRRAATTGSMSTGSLDGASTAASSSSKQQQLLPSGMIMIRDLPNDKPSHQGSIVAHFRPHTHPVTILTFNPSGTLLLSASSQGHTFHVYSLMDNKVIYKLSRGITDAQVTDARFTIDSLWCAVTTTKGTTHLYAINPYGGQPEIHGHAQSKVLNPKNHILTTLDGWKHVSPVSLSPMVRIKQRHPMQSKNNNDSNRHVPLNSFDNRSSSTTIPYSNTGVESPITSPPFLSALSSTPYLNDDSVRLATLFLPVTKIPYHHDQKQQGSSSPYSSSGLPWLKNQANQLGHMLPTGMMDATIGRRRWSDDARIFGFDEEQQQEEEDRPLAVAHRDLLSVHPDGILTLHRCCMTETLVQTREHGRAVERLELITKESDVAEWHVARYPNWNQVKEPIDKASSSSTTVSKHGWLSCAEIATYDNSSLEQPIWMTPGFSMHVFTGGTIEEQLNQGTVPQTQVLDFKRDMPEPYNIRVNRVGKTSIAIASKEGRVEGEALDDALNELKDNLSSAMKTSFSPSTPTQYLGTSPIMRLSSSADAQSVDRESPLSFEDAQLISLGAEDVTYSPQRTRHNDTNESEEVIFFSPDGDNEIASPHDSITDDEPNKPDDDNEIPSHDSITSNEQSHNDNISS